MTRIGKLAAGVLTLALVVGSAWGQSLSSAVWSTAFKDYAKKKHLTPDLRCFVGIGCSGGFGIRLDGEDTFIDPTCERILQFPQVTVPYCGPATSNVDYDQFFCQFMALVKGGRPAVTDSQACDVCCEESQDWTPAVAADCLKLWNLLWTLGCYHDAEDMAQEACRLDPQCLEAKHALIVSQLVKAVYGRQAMGCDMVVIGPPSPCVVACCSESVCGNKKTACASTSSAACAKGSCQAPQACCKSAASCACGENCRCAKKKTCACGSSCKCAQASCACVNESARNQAENRKNKMIRRIHRDMANGFVFMPGTPLPPPPGFVPPMPMIPPGAWYPPVPPMFFPRPGMMSPVCPPQATYFSVPVAPGSCGMSCQPSVEATAPEVISTPPCPVEQSYVPPPAKTSGIRPVRYQAREEARTKATAWTTSCTIPGFFEVSCVRMEKLEGNRILFEGDVTMTVHMENQPAKIVAQRILVNVSERTYEVNPEVAPPAKPTKVPAIDWSAYPGMIW